ncbi:SUR7/PalI family-domain-containing protein [Kockovaella imperatae]|uniref:SUR7/PalI family-domain-containing protein n=1 Tax=Kockovaella imperatae TaxID=4999 RepID=A0A1Y1UAQ6_9TREE|nr:SUR7/PalI family-domain-containing protein [Kockovaella imperatae]ORX35120.1 SUR7/PalI family-domain-containing protein [Kockovaella imperatae]
MGLGPVHCGSFFLFCAFALLLIATISSPIIKQIGFLNIHYNGETSRFGTFGYCLDGVRECSKSKLGYDLTRITGAGLDYRWTNETLNGSTKALILHPIAMGIAFIAFLITLVSDHVGFIFAAFITFLAFIVSLVAMIIDFAVFGIVKREVNDHTNAVAKYGVTTWLTLAATIVLFFSVFIVFFSCCTHRKNHRKEYDNSYNNAGYVGNEGTAYGTKQPWHKRFFNRNKNANGKY